MKTSRSYTDEDLRLPNLSWGIFLISVLGLFLETLFIRWVGTEIRIFAYLQNTILVACFLGIGLGLFTSGKVIDLRQSLIPILILLVIQAVPAGRAAMGSISEMLSTLGDFLIWSDRSIENTASQIFLVTIGLALTFGVLILVVDIFVPLGRILGRLMNAHSNPIQAYSVNILGSLLGTWLFALLSFILFPPFAWFFTVALLFAFFIYYSGKNRQVGFILLSCILLLSWFVSRDPGAKETIWSPYQKLVLKQSQPDEIGAYQLTVNNASYQEIMNLSEAYVSADPERYTEELKGLSQYDIPLLLHPNPQTFLVVGSGTGNDVAGALRHNMPSVTAVEIDPAIINLGRKYHPEYPYASESVQIINDDARSFFATTGQKFDIIAFGLLDSHTTTSLTNARLDHYVYTKESISQAKTLLKPGGVLVMNFYAQRAFIVDRMARLLEEVFGQKPIIFVVEPSNYGRGGVMFLTGDLGSIQHQLDQNPRLAKYIQAMQQKYPLHPANKTKVISDDWPYLYLESPSIPVLFYLLIGLMVILFIRSNRRWESHINFAALNRDFWHFFFLGAAFLLLEVQNISKASVVLGNTWQVNVVIISGVLAMALAANLIAYKFPNLPLKPIYLLLIGSCIGLYFVDLARFAILPSFTKPIVVGVLTSLPMLFSGIIFTRSFVLVKEKSLALGSNLIGALVGALLQSMTFVTGIKSLLLVVALFYLLSFLTIPSRTEAQEVSAAEFAQ